MTSSTKPEVHNVMHCRQKKEDSTTARERNMYKNFAMFRNVVLETRADRHMGHTGTLIVIINQLECGPMPNVMAALPNKGGDLFTAATFG